MSTCWLHQKGQKQRAPCSATLGLTAVTRFLHVGLISPTASIRNAPAFHPQPSLSPGSNYVCNLMMLLEFLSPIAKVSQTRLGKPANGLKKEESYPESRSITYTSVRPRRKKSVSPICFDLLFSQSQVSSWVG